MKKKLESGAMTIFALFSSGFTSNAISPRAC
jgi:hypothetical protein